MQKIQLTADPKESRLRDRQSETTALSNNKQSAKCLKVVQTLENRLFRLILVEEV